MTWLIVALAGLLGGTVQGLTGFGAVIMMMILLPNILPIDQSAGVAGVMMVTVNQCLNTGLPLPSCH